MSENHFRVRGLIAVTLVGSLFSGLSLAGMGDESTSGTSIIHRMIECPNGTMMEQVAIPGTGEIVAYLNYEKDAPRPMPVLLGYPSPREKKVAELMTDASPTTHAQISEPLPELRELEREMLLRGCAVVCSTNSKPAEHPWPEGKERWVWPTPDPAGVEAFAQSAMYAPGDFGHVIDYVETRPDLRADRIGYVGGSTTALIGYGLISQEPRISCAVLNAGSGDLAGFAEGWARIYDWDEKGFEVWDETRVKLEKYNPLLFVDRIYPRALLMINGGKDWLIPIESARNYFEALYPYYAEDPDRLQFVVFEGAGHGWDQKWNQFMVVDWLDRYLIQETPPEPRPRPKEE